MANYRLKKEAYKFFKEKYATTIQSLDYWGDRGVDKMALEEVEDIYIVFGHRKDNNNSLCGWSDDESHFHFTLKFPNTKHKEHDQFTNGKSVRELMDKIQQQVNYFRMNFAKE